MLSRKTYDVVTILFIVLFIGLHLLSFQMRSNITSEVIEDYREGGRAGNLVEEIEISMSGTDYKIASFIGTFANILSFIYYILILILVIQLHKRGVFGMMDTVIMSLLVPLAVVFYPLSIRKKFKQFETRESSNDSLPVSSE